MLRKSLLIAAACSLMAGPALADTLQLTGTLRDFKRGDQTGGHPDFETCSTVTGHGSYGHVINMVNMALGTDYKPVFNPTRPSSTNNTMVSADYFKQWFNDTPNVNLSMPFTIALSNGSTSPGGVYSYSNSAFFPIDGLLLGNQNQKDAAGKVHNFSFTFEIHTKFSYTPGQNFTFIGDDDVWVYINGMKVMDLGGVHSAITGTNVLLDGKAFITAMGTTAYTADGTTIKSVSTTMASQMATLWTNLGLTGTCPVKAGNPYIDLNLNSGGGDVKCTFASKSVVVRTGNPLVSCTLQFSDGTTQVCSGLSGNSATLTGTGTSANKTLAGAWVKSGSVSGDGVYFGADGSGGANCTLDFFFAERHVTSSDFRIDTSMNLKAVPLTTVSPLYD